MKSKTNKRGFRKTIKARRGGSLEKKKVRTKQEEAREKRHEELKKALEDRMQIELEISRLVVEKEIIMNKIIDLRNAKEAKSKV